MIMMELVIYLLGKSSATKSGRARGEEVIFNPKIYVAGFGNLYTGLFEHEIDKKKSNFRVQGMINNFNWG